MFEIGTIFLLLMWVISFPFSKKTSTKEGFFVSSRKMGVLTLSFTLAATTIGGSAIVISLDLIKRYGAWGILIDLCGGLGLIILSFTLAPLVRKTNALTLPSILKNNLEEKEYKIIAIALVIAEVCWIGLSIQGIKLLGHFSTFETLVITFLIVFYSLTGGQWSVSKTDIVQFILIVFGLFLFAIKNNKIVEFNNNLPDFFLLYLGTLMFLSHIIGPDIYSKILSAKDGKTAKNGSLYSGILKILFSILLLLAARKGLSLKNINSLIFLVIFSAIVSSIDSMLITSSSIICEDLFTIQNKKTIKLSTLIVAVLSFLLTTYIPNMLSLLASGYTVLLIIITFPVLSFFLYGKIVRKVLVIPPLIFASVFIITNSPVYSFFISLFAGGLSLAYTKVYS